VKLHSLQHENAMILQCLNAHDEQSGFGSVSVAHSLLAQQ
jgi:hypothetical protein